MAGARRKHSRPKRESGPKGPPRGKRALPGAGARIPPEGTTYIVSWGETGTVLFVEPARLKLLREAEDGSRAGPRSAVWGIRVRRLAVGQRQRQQRRLAKALDRIARRRTGVRTEDALRRRIRSPRRCVIRTRERILGPRTAREVRQHGSVVRGHRIRAGILHREVFDRQLEAVHVRLHARLASTVLHRNEVRTRDRRQDPDDHNHNHQLNESETLRVPHLSLTSSPYHSLDALLKMCPNWAYR